MGKLVSAVVITHNRKKLLKRAIESVYAQTYGNIELIVVNDNSTDGTTEYLNELSTERKMTVVNINAAHPRGGGYARNIGISKSNGAYIAFLDDDDVWLPQKIETQVSLLNDNASYGMVYCRRIDKDYQSGYEKAEKEKGKMDGDLSKVCCEKTICTSSSMMIRRSLLNKIGGFDEGLAFWQDFELNIRIANSSLIGYIPTPLMVYSLGNNDKHKLTNKFNGWWKAIKFIENKHVIYFNSLNDDEMRKWHLMIYKDAARRCKKSRLFHKERQYRYKVWKLDKSLYNLARLVLNY